MQGLSPLYLAVDGKVVGVLGIEDPLKPGVREAIADLHALGVKHVVMLTGDSERTAERIAREAGVDEFKAELLPEDKYAYVERIKREGRHVAMVGDGVNDSPALGLADVGLGDGWRKRYRQRGRRHHPYRSRTLPPLFGCAAMSQGLIDRSDQFVFKGNAHQFSAFGTWASRASSLLKPHRCCITARRLPTALATQRPICRRFRSRASLDLQHAVDTL